MDDNNPKVRLNIQRDSEGNIEELEYYIFDPGEDRKNILEFLELATTIFREEGPRNVTRIDKE